MGFLSRRAIAEVEGNGICNAAPNEGYWGNASEAFLLKGTALQVFPDKMLRPLSFQMSSID